MAGKCQPVNTARGELVALSVGNSLGCSWGWRWGAALHVPVGSAKAQGAAAAGAIALEGPLERGAPGNVPCSAGSP